jgi:hypothetical protein
MESAKTALEAKLEFDRKELIARQQATQIIYMLDHYIPKAAMAEAEYYLTDQFRKHEVQITTKETRELANALSRSPSI